MQFDWRAMFGPALTAATALLAILADHCFADHHFNTTLYPAALFVCIVAFAGSLSGLASAAISAAIALGCMALVSFNRHAGYDTADLIDLSMLSVAVGGTAAITGVLRQRWVEAFARESVHHATAEHLSAALDQVDIGIVLLDAETRAEFINRAFRRYFSLPDAKADSRPPFIALLYHGRDTRAHALPEDELNAYVARRMEMVRIGDSTPINIRLADGKVLRFSCTVLPDGGRMLSYTPVTDLIRETGGSAKPKDDETKDDEAEDYLSLRDLRFVPPLRAAE
jgi:PAS domain-containing protein